MNTRLLLILLAFTAFIALGLPDGLLGIAWPFIRAELGLPLAANGLLIVTGTVGGALSGLVSAWFGRKLGIGRLLALSSVMSALALVGYAIAPSVQLMMLAALIMGLAAGATDAAVNGFVAKHYSARLMQWLHASFGVGITIGPAMMTLLLVNDFGWRSGYWAQAVIQGLLAITFFVTAGLWYLVRSGSGGKETEIHAADAHETPMQASVREIRVWLSMAMFFLYCGLEFSVGLWSFSLLTDVRGVSTGQAGTWVSVYWGMFTGGRIVMGIVADRLSQQTMILVSFVSAALATLLFAFSDSGWHNLTALAVLGFAYAPVYPALMSGTLQRVGAKHFNNSMGLQVSAASLGIAAVPSALGLIASVTSLAIYPFLLLVITGALIGCFVASHRLASLPVSEVS